MLTRRERWDCPACAAVKLSKITKHLVTRCETLCWGLYSATKIKNAARRNIGYLNIGFVEDVKITVAGSHLYEPNKPSLNVVEEVISHVVTRQISRVGWSDNWRPTNDANPERWDRLDAKTDDLSRVQLAINRAGCIDGNIPNRKSFDEIKSTIEQILNGVTLN